VKQLLIEREIKMRRNLALTNDVAVTTQRVVLYLESLIKRSPVQWNWLTVRMINYKDAVLSALKMIRVGYLAGEKSAAVKTSRDL